MCLFVCVHVAVSVFVDVFVCVCVCVYVCLPVSVFVDVSVCACVCVCVSSYKEQSDDATESDDLIEVEMTEADHEREAAETIEKVLRHRVGRKGGM